MSVVLTVGKRELQGDDIVSLLSGYNLLPQLMEAMVVDRALRTLVCSSAAIGDYYAAEVAADAAFLDKKRAQLLLPPRFCQRAVDELRERPRPFSTVPDPFCRDSTLDSKAVGASKG